MKRYAKSKLPACPFDGKECTGVISAGGPACSISNFGCLGDDVQYRCPRLK
jgi:hypothetical protein